MKKILFLFPFLMSLFFGKVAFAATVELPELPSNVRDYLIYNSEDGSEIRMIFTQVGDSYSCIPISNDFTMYVKEGDFTACLTGRYVLKNNEWVLVVPLANNSFVGAIPSNFLYSSQDVFSSSVDGELVFAKKSVPLPAVPILPTAVGGVALMEVMKVTLALVGSVVSLIVLSTAFRKSWSWLQSLLLQS